MYILYIYIIIYVYIIMYIYIIMYMWYIEYEKRYIYIYYLYKKLKSFSYIPSQWI